MKQIWVAKSGSPDALEIREAADPIPRTGEVRIRVAASGVNVADLLGQPGDGNRASVPYVPGYEVAGVVDMVAQGVSTVKEGDRVVALTQGGGYSDLKTVSHRRVFSLLDWMKLEDAAALPVDYVTAFASLLVVGSLRKGDQVLIHAAGSGVGLAALNICQIVGAETIGTAPGDRHDFLRKQGLDSAIDLLEEDYEEAVRELTGGKGVQLILNPFAGLHYEKNSRLLAETGRLVHYANESVLPSRPSSILERLRSAVFSPMYTPLWLMKESKGMAGINFLRLWKDIDLVRPWMEQLMDWYDEALFRPHVDSAFRFERVGEAHNYVRERRNLGKVLLVP